MDIQIQWARATVEAQIQEHVSAQEWEMKYRALAAGVTDQAMIDNAAKVVDTAHSIASSRGAPVEEVFWYLLDAISVLRRDADHAALERSALLIETMPAD